MSAEDDYPARRPKGGRPSWLDAEDLDDYLYLQDLLVRNRRNLTTHRLEIQIRNYNNSPLLQLPTEILLQVFKHLDKVDLFSLLTVCREFSELIVEILWFRPNMQSDKAFLKIRDVMMLPRTETHWDYRNYIKRLNISFMTSLVTDDLLYLFEGCPKLERLTLVNCSQLSHLPIARVLQLCDRLQSIDMTGVQDIQDDIIYALAQNCTRLQGLYAPGCGNISEEAIITLLKACPMLKRIKFNNSENITDDTIAAMYDNCKSLVEIDLHNCPKVTDRYLKSIFLELNQLREFRISNAAGITDALFDLIPADHHLDKLRIIDVTGCNAITDRLVEGLVRCAPRLRNVVLSKCMQITDASLRHLTKLGRSLHYIHLGHCALITDYGVQALVRACYRIQYIDLACCSQLTDWTLIELSGLPKLKRIGLVKCNLISDSGIAGLVRLRGERDCLERVHLSYCTNLTIGPIYCLLKTCPRLTHLSLTGISAFLRREFTQYCRDPPPDFTENQRSSFCVFSGNGVSKLRNYLDNLMQQRASLLEEYGITGEFNQQSPARRRRLQPREGGEREGFEDEPPNVAAAFNNFNTVLANPMNNDDDMTTWAAHRGLPELARLRVDQRAREIRRAEMNGADPLAMAQDPTRFLPQPMMVADPMELFRPDNAPQIVQSAVFDDVTMTGNEDDMDVADLFPPPNFDTERD